MEITGHTRLTGLLGSPVAHSISPLMHNEAFRLLGLDYAYLCFDVKEEGLKAAVEGLKNLGARGFNLTMPNKNKMAELADELSPAASLIGAVNTVLNDGGRLIGHNTDGTGFMRSVRDSGCRIAGREITVLGAGGAATAICAQAALDGAKQINIFSRPSSRFHGRTVRLTDTISRRTACTARMFDLADRTALRACLADSVLLVNATSVGMAPDTQATLIADASLFHEGLTVSDVIYEPRETRLLSLAARAGCRTFNGMYMLLYQGAEAFRIWTGREMPVEEIRRKYFAGEE